MQLSRLFIPTPPPEQFAEWFDVFTSHIHPHHILLLLLYIRRRNVYNQNTAPPHTHTPSPIYATFADEANVYNLATPLYRARVVLIPPMYIV